MLLTLVKLVIPSFIKSLIKRCIAFIRWSPYQVISFSQEGEDIILRRIFDEKKNGFYIDVGAHHPKRFSNTYLFYKSGWRGINIDAMPGSMDLFKMYRPLDINIETPVLREIGMLTYYEFNEPALNGFSKELSESRDGFGVYKIINKIELKGFPLSNIIENNILPPFVIDFLSVDVEGLDLEVLESNDWQRFRPKVVLVEVLTDSIDTIASNSVALFMKKNGYLMYAKSVNTVFFLSEEYFEERRAVGNA